MSELSEFQRSVGEWGDETFKPTENYDSCDFISGRINHLKKEVSELEQTWNGEELADCFLLLLHISHITKVDLFEEARKKMVINRVRTWGKPDKDGVIEHIRTEGINTKPWGHI